MTDEKFTEEHIAEALEASDGLVHATLAYLHGRADGEGRTTKKGLPVRVTRRWLDWRIRTSERLTAVKADVEETLKDLAEERVIGTIRSGGGNAVRAATWFLERKGADRGYSPKADMMHAMAQALVSRYELPREAEDPDSWRRMAAAWDDGTGPWKPNA